MPETVTKTPAPKLRGNPSATDLEDFTEALVKRTPDTDITESWARDILRALPLPVPKPPRVYHRPVARAARLTSRIAKIQAMIAYITQEVIDLNYWRYPDVRAALTAMGDANEALLAALHSRAERDGDIMSAPEEGAVSLIYSRVRQTL